MTDIFLKENVKILTKMCKIKNNNSSNECCTSHGSDKDHPLFQQKNAFVLCSGCGSISCLCP